MSFNITYGGRRVFEKIFEKTNLEGRQKSLLFMKV